MRRPTIRDEAGFTLVEVVVAFAVVVLVLASIYHAVAGAYRGEARAQVRDQALAQARAHLEVIGIEQPLRARRDHGHLRHRRGMAADNLPRRGAGLQGTRPSHCA